MSESAAEAECGVAHGHDHAATDRSTDERVLVAVYAGGVASALLRFAAECGFRTVLVEPDAGTGVPDGLPSGAEQVRAVTELPTALLGRADVVVCDHHRDDLGVHLRDALSLGARWVGIMGSPRHEAPHPAALAVLGVAPAEIARVHRPIGLDIGSRSPAEIAVSTLAGLLADRNGRPGGFYGAGSSERTPLTAS